ncbi:MAG: MFS transporter, partial [Muribaculaceae bacterium]|nr:MFS transporter [Muribaculaceae bacterium]
MSYVFLIIYLVGLSAFGSFVNDMYMPSLPSMVRFFHCSVPVCELGVAFGMAGLGLGEIIMGPMSDRYGRKPVLYASLGLFVVAAVVSVFSTSIHFFIGCRFFQGCGAAGGYFLARTIPTDIFGGRMLAKIMAVVGAINGFAPASAPVIGGVVSQYFGWKGVFIILTLFAVLLFCLATKLKETLPPARRNRGNLVSIFSNYGTLLRNRPFMIHSLLKGSALGMLFAYISSAPFIIQTHFGFSQINFGLIIGANSIMAAAGSLVALKFKNLKNAASVAAVILLVASVA